MKKLTDKIHFINQLCNINSCGYVDIFNRLKEYEDLDLTPEEIREIVFTKTEKRFSKEAIMLAFKFGIEAGIRLEKETRNDG